MTTTSKHPNHLIHELSPYLLQHAYNPVDWYPWNEEAFAKAKAAGHEVLHIVIIDDVITTGSTIINCARAILEAVPDEAEHIRFSVMSVALAGQLRMGRITPEKLHIKDCTVSSEEFVALQHRPLA